MKPPCTVMAQYVLPTLRMLIIRELVERRGMRRVEASRKVGLTPAAVTQYMKGKRGQVFMEELSKSEYTMKIVSEIADAIKNGDMSSHEITQKICVICKKIRSEEFVFKMYKNNYED
jgi:predicted transcriptional regulator